MNYITIVLTLIRSFMTGETVVRLKNGERITASEVKVLSQRNGEWIRCVRDEPSPRMGFDETTTYYHLERDVESVDASDDDRSTASVETERNASDRAKIANALDGD